MAPALPRPPTLAARPARSKSVSVMKLGASGYPPSASRPAVRTHMSSVVRRSLLALGLALCVALPTASPSQAAIPLPHEDPFYGFDSSALTNVPRGTVLRARSVTVGTPGSGAGAV